MKCNSLLMSLCLLLIIPSCSKDKDDPVAGAGEIRCKIDGETRVFLGTHIIVLNQNAGAHYTYFMTGSVDGDQFTITVDENGTIATADYSAQGEGPTQSRKAKLQFVDNPGNNQYFSSAAEEGSATVTLTSITPTSVKGTFSGKVALGGNFAGGAVKTISGGSFEAEF